MSRHRPYEPIDGPSFNRVEAQAADDYRKALRHAAKRSAELARFLRDGGSLDSDRGHDVNLSDIKARQNVRNCLAALQAAFAED